MTAPKLTEAQRRELVHAASHVDGMTSVMDASTGPRRHVVERLVSKGFLERRGHSQRFAAWYRITDAGRAALRGES